MQNTRVFMDTPNPGESVTMCKFAAPMWIFLLTIRTELLLPNPGNL